MSDIDENEDQTVPAPAAAPRNGSAAAAAKVTPVRPAQAVPKSMQSKAIDWQPENGWVSKMADDRLNEVAERARLKGKSLRDIRVTITRINEDQTEQRIGNFSADTVQGANNPYAGNAGLGGPVVSPGEALFGVLRRFHYGSPVKAIYRVECWDQTNDGKMITSSFIQLAPSAQLDKMDQAAAAARPQTTFEPGLGNPQAQGSGHPSHGFGGGYMPPQMQMPQGTDPMIVEMMRRSDEQARYYQEQIRSLYEKMGQPVPTPPPGLGLPQSAVESPEVALLKKELELVRAQLPKPKSDTEVLAEKMVAGFASILDKKFPNIGIGAAVEASPQTPTSKPPLTRLQQMEKELEEEEKMWSLEERFKKMRAKYGLGEASEPEAPPPPAEPAKPEDKLPVNLVPIEGLQLFGQPFYSVSRKDGEDVGLGQQIIDHVMHNPGAQEQVMRFAMAFAEKAADPIMNLLGKLGQATAPRSAGSPQMNPGVGGNPGGGGGMSGAPSAAAVYPPQSHRAQVVDEVPEGAVDAGDKSNEGGVI